MTSGCSLDHHTFIERFTPFVELDAVIHWLRTLAILGEQGSYFLFAKIVVDLACNLLENIDESTSGALIKASIFEIGGAVPWRTQSSQRNARKSTDDPQNDFR